MRRINKYHNYSMGRFAALSLFLALIMTFLGCCNHKKVLAPVPNPKTRQQALEDFNRNALAVQDFSARIDEWEIQFYEEENKKHHFNEKGGKIFYRTVREGEQYPQFYLNASGGPLGQEALVVSSNQEEFWMYSRPGKWSYRDTHENAVSLEAPNMFIMNPQFILEFIGLQPIPLDILPEPYPIYKVAPEKNYIEYALPGENGLREIVIDRRSNLPEQINLYDRLGLRVLESRLGNYQTLGEAILPGDIYLSSPNDNTFFRLQLINYQIKDNISDRLFEVPVDFESVSDKS